jgi:hypothetical protein
MIYVNDSDNMDSDINIDLNKLNNELDKKSENDISINKSFEDSGINIPINKSLNSENDISINKFDENSENDISINKFDENSENDISINKFDENSENDISINKLNDNIKEIYDDKTYIESINKKNDTDINNTSGSCTMDYLNKKLSPLVNAYNNIYSYIANLNIINNNIFTAMHNILMNQFLHFNELKNDNNELKNDMKTLINKFDNINIAPSLVAENCAFISYLYNNYKTRNNKPNPQAILEFDKNFPQSVYLSFTKVCNTMSIDMLRLGKYNIYVLYDNAAIIMFEKKDSCFYFINKYIERRHALNIKTHVSYIVDIKDALNKWKETNNL